MSSSVIYYDAGGGEGDIRLRWWDGNSLAVVFTMGKQDRFATTLENALIEFRRYRPTGRAELHVEAAPDRWTDPILAYPEEAEVYVPPMPNATVNGQASKGWTKFGGYVHVINVVPPDPEGTGLKVRGKDVVLVIGPECRHADGVYGGCIASVWDARLPLRRRETGPGCWYWDWVCGGVASPRNPVIRKQE